jgi:hypothetical protein
MKIDLFQAYYDARRNKRNTVNQLRFEIDYEHHLLELYEELVNRTYVVSKSITFIVNKPVKREIFAADFRDRVLHHLVYNYINPLIESQLIDDCYSCRKEKGTHYGIQRVTQFLKDCSCNYTRDCYILKLERPDSYLYRQGTSFRLDWFAAYKKPFSYTQGLRFADRQFDFAIV